MELKLRSAAGSADIAFPSEMFPMEGFCGVHDAPKARVLLLDCRERFALAVLELVMLPPPLLDECRKIISEATGTPVENVWVQVTHAISTPHMPMKPLGKMPPKMPEMSEFDEMWGPGVKPPRTEEPEMKAKLYASAVIEAVREASPRAEMLRLAKLGIGEGSCDVNICRSEKTSFGWWIGGGSREQCSKRMTALRIDALDGSPICLLVNYGLKPCALDNCGSADESRLVSADVPGEACRLLEEQYHVPVIFSMSAAANQVPRTVCFYQSVSSAGSCEWTDRGLGYGFKAVASLGREMARSVARIYSMTYTGSGGNEIKTSEVSFSWPKNAPMPKRPRQHAEYKSDGEAQTGAKLVKIGKLALVGVREEMTAVTEAQLQKYSPTSPTLLLTMVNGGAKYLPHKEAYDKAMWEAQSAPLGPGGAEALMDLVVEELNKMH